MATDFIRLAALVQAYANLVAAQNNMLQNVAIIKAAQLAGTLTVPVAQAMNDLGTAFAQRLAQIQEILLAHDASGAGVLATDINALVLLLNTQATALVASKPTTVADVAAIDASVTAAVPVTVSPFVVPTPIITSAKPLSLRRG